ncbi:MAG: IPT/TIG domain-containing protein [Bacteroidota bacterium]
MKRKFEIIKLLKIGLPTFIISIMLVYCTNEVTPSLYDSVKDGPEKPVINSISPESGLAGITEFTLNGENFSTVLEENVVYFGSTPAVVLSASETQITVLPPNVVQDSIAVYMNTTSTLYSDTILVDLKSAINEVYAFADFELPYAITADKDGNIYLSLSGEGVKKLTPEGELTDFAPKGGETFYSALQYGTGEILYGVRGVRALFKIEEGQAPATFAVFENGTSMFDLDFDKDHNLWLGGKGGKIYRVPNNPTGTNDWKSFEFESDINALKVYNDYLYISASSETSEDIYRKEIISADSLGANELVFSILANFEDGIKASVITFTADGQMLLGTNDIDPIKFVNPDGSFGNLYEGVITPEIISFTWGMGDELYVTVANEEIQTIYSVNIQKSGAPQYGRE